MDKGKIISTGVVYVRADSLLHAVVKVENTGCAAVNARPTSDGRFAVGVRVTQSAGNKLAHFCLPEEDGGTPEMVFSPSRRSEGPVGDHLEDVSVEAVGALLRAVERVTDERCISDVIDDLKAGGGLGLLGADAMSQAVKRIGAWPVIEQVESFFARFAQGGLGTPTLQTWQDKIAELRDRRSDVSNAEEPGKAEDAREGYLVSARREIEGGSLNALEASMALLCGLAAWASWLSRPEAAEYRPEDTLERAADDAGMDITATLARQCGDSAAWEFVLSLRALGSEGVAKPSPSRTPGNVRRGLSSLQKLALLGATLAEETFGAEGGDVDTCDPSPWLERWERPAYLWGLIDSDRPFTEAEHALITDAYRASLADCATLPEAVQGGTAAGERERLRVRADLEKRGADLVANGYDYAEYLVNSRHLRESAERGWAERIAAANAAQNVGARLVALQVRS